MNNEPDDTQSCAPDRHKKLRQLQHDMNNHLGIVTMGLQALEGARSEPDTFVEICRMIKDSGVEPLKDTVSEILDIACNNEASG